MKLRLLWTTLLMLSGVQIALARTVEVDVYGMTCAFCADSLERKFGKMESVSKIEISLKNKKIRLETEDNQPSLDAIKQTILDAGFTPEKITIVPDEKK